MMLVRLPAWAFAVLLCALTSVSAHAAQTAALTPLRTLVYHVSYSAQTRNQEQTSGFLSGAGAGAIAYGNAQVDRRSTVDDDGTLTVDVIAATGDGGLVVDAAYAGTNSAQPKLRIAIMQDGRLVYDPRQALSVQAQRVLPLLARGLIAGRDVSPGASWSTPHAAPGKGTVSYNVRRTDGGAATLATDDSFTVPGTQGFSENDRGIVVYQTDRLCPASVDLSIHERHMPEPEQYASTEGRLTASLVRDSFAAKFSSSP